MTLFRSRFRLCFWLFASILCQTTDTKFLVAQTPSKWIDRAADSDDRPEKIGDQTLIFAEEFNDEIAPSRWTLAQSDSGTAELVDGVLRISARPGKTYLPVSLSTQHHFESLYGTYQIRVRFHDNDSAWAGFWLLDGDEEKLSAGNPWHPNLARVEIFRKEQPGDDTYIGLGWDSGDPQYPIFHKRHRLPGLGTGFHEITLQWTPHQYIYSIDGVEFFRTGTGEVATKSKSMALFVKNRGGKEKAGQDSSFAPVMEVDYIRVYNDRPAETSTTQVTHPVKRLSLRSRPGEGMMVPDPPAGKRWREVFQDDFSGSTLDPSKWQKLKDQWRKGGWWRASNVRLNGEGQLVIRTTEDPINRGDFASGAVRTKGRFSNTYGFYTARVKLQKEPGQWSAFWLQSDQFFDGTGGMDGAEIDIFENAWTTDRIDHGIHFDGYQEFYGKSRQIIDIPGLKQGYHTFSLWWTPEMYIFFVDGVETYRTNIGGINTREDYIIFSTEIGGWGGKITDAKLPDEFLVDEVRVYVLDDANDQPSDSTDG